MEQVDDLADAIREALQVATEGRPGPVLVDIPKDVQQAKAVGVGQLSAGEHVSPPRSTA